MANIIPMAGLGSRFAEAGYKLPKALIPVSGKPMIARVIESLPPADKSIFIVRQEHIDQYKIDVLITQHCPNAIIIGIDKTTEGQASTCMLAMAHLDPEEDMFIAACDNSFLYDHEAFEKLKSDTGVDAVVWTFTRNKLLAEKPEAWGWVKLEEDQRTIADMSVKIPVSSDPFHDHAVVATFYFKRAADFAAAYDAMVRENYRIKNEFYVDSMPIFYKHMGKRSVIFDVDLYVGWGKPQDLYEYELWEYVCAENIPYGDPRDQELWKRFFMRYR